MKTVSHSISNIIGARRRADAFAPTLPLHDAADVRLLVESTGLLVGTETPELTAPKIHLNGSGKQYLLDGYADTASALRNAFELLHKTVPNARDYYVLSDGEAAFKQAMIEHESRKQRLISVLAELDAIGENIADQ